MHPIEYFTTSLWPTMAHTAQYVASDEKRLDSPDLMEIIYSYIAIIFLLHYSREYNLFQCLLTLCSPSYNNKT